MNTRLPFIVACAALASIFIMPAFAETKAADGHEPQHEQQNRMKACNVEAAKKDLHGDERRAFMSECLKKRH